MAKYLLIESSDPFDSNDVASFYELANGLVQEGDQVTVFLVQNGVLPARRSTKSKPLSDLAQNGVEVLARHRHRSSCRRQQGHLALRRRNMSDNKTITFALMDAPYENARSTTALRLIDIAARRGYTVNVFAYGKLDWINCGLCVDERGVHEALEFARRGTPGDLWKWAESSDNTLVIPTK